MLKILKEIIFFGLKSCFCWLTATSHHLLKKEKCDSRARIIIHLDVTLWAEPEKWSFRLLTREKLDFTVKRLPLYTDFDVLPFDFTEPILSLCCCCSFGGRCAVCLQLGRLFVFEEAGEWYHKTTFRCFFLKTSVSKRCAFWNVRTLDTLFVEVHI